MDTLRYTLDAILPILLIVVSGYVMRRVGPWDDDFYKRLNALCFHFFLPIQIFMNVYALESLSFINWRVFGLIVAGIFFSLGLGAVLSGLLTADPARRAVLIQDSFRSNQAVLGLPLAQALGGVQAAAYTSFVIAVTVPLFNVLAVIILTLGGSGHSGGLSLRRLFRQVITNPLVIAGLSALIVVILRQFIPAVDGERVFSIRTQLYPLYAAMDKLSVVASPVMLFALGARFEFSAVAGLMKLLVFGTLMRLVICPLIVISAALLLSGPLALSLVEMPTLISVFCTSGAVSGAVMAQELGCDDQLAAQLVVWTTFFSLFTISIFVFLLRFFGLL